MAASGVLAAGTTAYSSTIAAASTAELVNFSDRYGYVTVTNTSATAGQLLYVRMDGQAATIGGTNCYAVAPGETAVFANQLPLWYQSSNVIPKGVNQFGNSNTASSPASPGTVTPMESLAGQMQNPGTRVSVISATVSLPYTVAAAG